MRFLPRASWPAARALPSRSSPPGRRWHRPALRRPGRAASARRSTSLLGRRGAGNCPAADQRGSEPWPARSRTCPATVNSTLRQNLDAGSARRSALLAMRDCQTTTHRRPARPPTTHHDDAPPPARRRTHDHHRRPRRRPTTTPTTTTDDDGYYDHYGPDAAAAAGSAAAAGGGASGCRRRQRQRQRQ